MGDGEGVAEDVQTEGRSRAHTANSGNVALQQEEEDAMLKELKLKHAVFNGAY